MSTRKKQEDLPKPPKEKRIRGGGARVPKRYVMERKFHGFMSPVIRYYYDFV